MSSIFDPITGIDVGSTIGDQPTYLTASQLGGGTSQSAFAGLDDLGSNTSNVASNLFASLGNLVAAQVNNSALAVTGRTQASMTAAQAANANKWQSYVMISALLLGIGVVFYAIKK